MVMGLAETVFLVLVAAAAGIVAVGMALLFLVLVAAYIFGILGISRASAMNSRGRGA